MEQDIDQGAAITVLLLLHTGCDQLSLGLVRCRAHGARAEHGVRAVVLSMQ